MNGRGPRFQSLPGVKNCGERFVFHLDQAEGLQRDFFGLGRHESHRIPDKPHLVPANHGLIGDNDPKTVSPGHIFGGQHRRDPGEFFGLFRINGFEQGMRMRASQNFPVQKAILRVIASEGQPPGDFLLAVPSLDPLPDHGQLGLGPGRNQLPEVDRLAG